MIRTVIEVPVDHLRVYLSVILSMLKPSFCFTSSQLNLDKANSVTFKNGSIFGKVCGKVF